MALNTRIRGAQIADEFTGTASATGLIRDGSGNVKLYVDTNDFRLVDNGLEIADNAISNVMMQDNSVGTNEIQATSVTDAKLNDDVASGLAGVGLSASSGVLAIDLNELTAVAVDVVNDEIAIVDATDSSTKKESIVDLVTAIAGSGLTATNGVLSVDSIANNIVEGDIIVENLSNEIGVSGYAGQHTLANTPITNSVQVFLNGLLQEEGSGKDYTLTGDTIQFATSPESGDILIIHYVINN